MCIHVVSYISLHCVMKFFDVCFHVHVSCALFFQSRQRSQTHVGMGGTGTSATGNENSLLTEMIEVLIMLVILCALLYSSPIQICVDMMARYTYSNISTQPIRFVLL